jgi:DNA transformation protein
VSEKLEDLPNIGPVLADRLRRAGAEAPNARLALGDAGAFAKLVAAFPEDACSHTRLALAGAVRGVRWHGLPVELRRELSAGLAR